jgi:plasmid maintenance system antidote protein VapI
MESRILRAKIIEKYGTQVDFAQELKIREDYISRVVRGRRKLSEAERIRWAQVLDVDPKIFGD